MDSDPKKQIARLVQTACALEACAPKPGNVNRNHDFPDTSLQDFILSAIAIGPAFEDTARMDVGQIILDAVRCTRNSVNTNTNLGMVLLLAPLAKTCARASGTQEIRAELGRVLNSLTVQDARLTYEAIRLAQPGGMGREPRADISGEPSITLLESMALARERDAIAREYSTDFDITFGMGLPALKQAQAQGGDWDCMIVQAFLNILSRVPDSLISRKMGESKAQNVSQMASGALAKGGLFTTDGRAAVAEMDRQLRDKDHRLNPGTTADLTAASIFLLLFEEFRG
jgi:triphosphoribosyl-dephospho-CoA synthase